jgi:hypothetical protein
MVAGPPFSLKPPFTAPAAKRLRACPPRQGRTGETAGEAIAAAVEASLLPEPSGRRGPGGASCTCHLQLAPPTSRLQRQQPCLTLCTLCALAARPYARSMSTAVGCYGPSTPRATRVGLRTIGSVLPAVCMLHPRDVEAFGLDLQRLCILSGKSAWQLYVDALVLRWASQPTSATRGLCRRMHTACLPLSVMWCGRSSDR